MFRKSVIIKREKKRIYRKIKKGRKSREIERERCLKRWKMKIERKKDFFIKSANLVNLGKCFIRERKKI